MRTSKPISTISYNSEEFFRLKAEELRKAGIFSEWYYIKHKPEEDEKKEHLHVYVVPSKLIQTDNLVKEFMEFDPSHPDKPLTCPRWQVSKFGDWYLYGIHNERYLAMKGQSRKFHYRAEDVQTFDQDALDDQVRELDITAPTKYEDMAEAMMAGVRLSDYITTRNVPIQMIRQYQTAWDMVANRTFRNGRNGHEEVFEDAPEAEKTPLIVRGSAIEAYPPESERTDDKPLPTLPDPYDWRNLNE